MKKITLSLVTTLSFLFTVSAQPPTKFIINPTMFEDIEENTEMINIDEMFEFQFNLDINEIKLFDYSEDEKEIFYLKIQSVEKINNEEKDMYFYTFLIDKNDPPFLRLEVALKRDGSWGGIWFPDAYLHGSASIK